MWTVYWNKNSRGRASNGMISNGMIKKLIIPRTQARNEGNFLRTNLEYEYRAKKILENKDTA